MKIGKVSQTVLKRSMLKPLQYKREDALVQPSVEEMCFGVRCKDEEDLLVSEAVLYGDEKTLGVYALAQVMNDLATRGAKMAGASVHIMLPPHAYESRLKSMMEFIEEAASARNVQIMCAKAEVCPAITTAIVYMTGVGILKKGQLIQNSNGKAEQDIVLLKWIGLEGTFRAIHQKEEELAKRFVPSFLNGIKQMETEIFSADEIAIANAHGASAMQQITSGGILATLWEMAEAADVGMSVEIKKMAIRQETVEVCEFCHLNPYQLTSAGSVLIFTEDGEGLVEKYNEKGVQATLIGRTTRNNERVILGGEEKRFLDRPSADELLKIYEKKEGC